MLRKQTFLMGRGPRLPDRPARSDGNAPFAPDWAKLPPVPKPPAVEYRPSPGWYRVQLAPERQQTASGLYLPGTWVENRTEAVVVAAGPEPFIGGGPDRAVMWAAPGDTVLFMKHSLKWTDPEAHEGVIHDRDLLAVDYPGEDELRPLNDFVRIRQDESISAASDSVVYAEEDRPRPMSGIVEAIGPGQVRLAGPFAGSRRPCSAIWGLRGVPADYLSGKRVYWTRGCQALAVGREALEFLLIRADDLIGWE